jgi:hypothetical protein
LLGPFFVGKVEWLHRWNVWRSDAHEWGKAA